MRAPRATPSFLRASALACALAAACNPAPLPPLGQVRFFIDTDASLPLAAGEIATADDPPPLFDRLRLELYEPGEGAPCDGCSRELGLDRTIVWNGQASVGFATRPGRTGYRLRVRLFRSTGDDVVTPRAASTLETIVELPVIAEEGIVDAHVVLHTTDIGNVIGTLSEPVAAEPGPATGHLAGTFASEARKDCSGATRDDDLCVRGGAYWMGDLTLGTAFGYSSSERLVVVSSFYLDKNEVTVAQLRASGLSTFMKVIGHGLNAECTYSDKPADRESLPVNCITRPGAEAYCALKGGRLPTEAEMELAASGRRSVYAPWGDDLASCPDAVFGRTYDANAAAGSKACLATGQGPMPVGSGAWDRLVLSGGDIVDLGGNLTEWTSDEWAQEGSDCWTGPLLYNPHCTKGDSPPGYSVRGASYAHPASQLRAAIRARVDADGGPLSSQIGFRCVRDM